MSAVIGMLDWDACNDCKHYPPDRGGCEVDGMDNVEIDYDFVVCRSFVDKNEPEVIEVNPNQMELLVE
jgi:hypothetical protein